MHVSVKPSMYDSAAYSRRRCSVGYTHVFELGFEHRDHILFDDYALVVEVFDDVVMIGTIDADDDRLDGRIAFNKDACRRC